jgi:hypothetical protein
MSVGPELIWVPPPGPDYIRTILVILDAFTLIKLQNKCSIISIFRIGGYLIHYLEVFRSEITNINLMMVDDSPGLDVDVFQGPVIMSLYIMSLDCAAILCSYD